MSTVDGATCPAIAVSTIPVLLDCQPEVASLVLARVILIRVVQSTQLQAVDAHVMTTQLARATVGPIIIGFIFKHVIQ